MIEFLYAMQSISSFILTEHFNSDSDTLSINLARDLDRDSMTVTVRVNDIPKFILPDHFSRDFHDVGCETTCFEYENNKQVENHIH